MPMLNDLFATALPTIVFVGVAAFAAGVFLSTKITDVFKGIPADLRATLNSVEADAKSAVTSAKATVVSTAVSTALTSALTKVAAAPVVKTASPATAAPAPAPLTPVAPLAPVAEVKAASPPITG